MFGGPSDWRHTSGHLSTKTPGCYINSAAPWCQSGLPLNDLIRVENNAAVRNAHSKPIPTSTHLFFDEHPHFRVGRGDCPRLSSDSSRIKSNAFIFNFHWDDEDDPNRIGPYVPSQHSAVQDLEREIAAARHAESQKVASGSTPSVPKIDLPAVSGEAGSAQGSLQRSQSCSGVFVSTPSSSVLSRDTVARHGVERRMHDGARRLWQAQHGRHILGREKELENQFNLGRMKIPQTSGTMKGGQHARPISQFKC